MIISYLESRYIYYAQTIKILFQNGTDGTPALGQLNATCFTNTDGQCINNLTTNYNEVGMAEIQACVTYETLEEIVAETEMDEVANIAWDPRGVSIELKGDVSFAAGSTELHPKMTELLIRNKLLELKLKK